MLNALTSKLAKFLVVAHLNEVEEIAYVPLDS
jgi:hypothetical protein